MKRSLSPLIAVTLLVLSFSSCTCSSSTPEAPPPKPRPDAFGSMLKPTERVAPDIPRGEVTPEGVEAREAPTLPAAAPSQAELPESFPADVPVYEGAEVAGVQPVPNNGHNVIFTVDSAEAPKVFSFYKDDLTRKGWKATQEYEGKDQSFLTFEKDGTLTNISITIDPKSGKRVIAVMYYEEKPLPFPEF
jgi:hypothetical protein